MRDVPTIDLTMREQATTNDPDQAVRVLEAHLGSKLATWQRYWVIALLSPPHQWPEGDDAEP